MLFILQHARCINLFGSSQRSFFNHLVSFLFFSAFQAVIEDCDDVVHVLVEGGADLNIKDADLWTPLHAAVACGNYDLVKYLNEKGADLVAINADGNMPIDLVDENEDIEMYLDSQMTEKGNCQFDQSQFQMVD